MKVLLDTNIIIHREAYTVVNKLIGQLFNWLDKLHYEKCIHPLTITELEKHLDKIKLKTLSIKLESYNILKTIAPIADQIQELIDNSDKNENDKNDSKLLNEVLCNRVDILITEDKNIHAKGSLLGIQNKLFDINSFLENVLSVHPNLVDYKVLAVKKEYFGNLNLDDEFFDSFREDYKDFHIWFNKKAEEISYVCIYNGKIRGFLYLKPEGINENYHNINPSLPPKRRLKIASFKVNLFGLKLGERFLKIIFDNALLFNVEEIYCTIFDKRTEQRSLKLLLNSFGFTDYGTKDTSDGKEIVLLRDFSRKANVKSPRLTYPYISKNSNIFFISIHPIYHTELFPDSILKTESPNDFVENQPHRNAISNVYISHAYQRIFKSGDILLFYRTGGIHRGVITTIGIVENVFDKIKNEAELRKRCRGKTVLTIEQISEFWNKFGDLKPFVINFLYTYSLPKRPNLASLIKIGLFSSPTDIPRGIFKIERSIFLKILEISESNGNIISN